MRRRAFITLLGGAAAWPLVARAQQTGKVSRIGFLGPSSPALERHLVDTFRQKLRELGHVEGENLVIEYRWAEGQDEQLPSLAAELVRLKPDVNSFQSPTSATRAVATIGPTPGISSSRRFLHSSGARHGCVSRWPRSLF